MKKLISLRISTLTETQLAELTSKLGMTQTDVVTMAINDFYDKMEVKMNTSLTIETIVPGYLWYVYYNGKKIGRIDKHDKYTDGSSFEGHHYKTIIDTDDKYILVGRYDTKKYAFEKLMEKFNEINTIP